MLHKFSWKDIKETGCTICLWGRVAGSRGKMESFHSVSLYLFFSFFLDRVLLCHSGWSGVT